MRQNTLFASSLSLRRIVGFACNQGFVFFLFYLELTRAISFGFHTVERIDLMGTLLCMALSFLLLRLLPVRAKKLVLARPFLLLYALMLAIGSLIPYFVENMTAVWLVVEAALLGLPCAVLLAAWGRSFGEAPSKVSVPEVFFASFLAALFVVLVLLVPVSRADLAFRILPFVSVAALMVSPQTDFSLRSLLTPDTSLRNTALLSAKIIAGTVLFGMAAGLMDPFNIAPSLGASSSSLITFILFAAFALGILSILISDGFGKGAALNKAYRSAIFIMLLGYLMVPAPFFVGSVVSGEAIVLAGYLGLSAILVSLFLVLAVLTGTSVISSFSRGFAALFGGEFVGTLLANALNTTESGAGTPYSVVIVAGVLVLFSYLFLFTERDFTELSELITNTNSFEDRCQLLIESYNLSAREAEILPFILKGRTSERISQELYISKSTVNTHFRRIYSKAGVHNRQELIDLSEASGK